MTTRIAHHAGLASSIAVTLVMTLGACEGTIGGAKSDALPPLGGQAISCDEPQAAGTAMRRLSVRQYQNVIRDVFDGLVEPSQAYPGASGTSVTGYSTEAALYDASEQGVEQVMLAADDVAERVANALGQILPCSTASDAGESCVGTFLDRFGKRAYRRPLEGSERERLLVDYRAGRADGAPFGESVALLVAHMMQTPQFVYVAEDAAPQRRTVERFEMASRLSFYFWDTIPDDELIEAAESGNLDDEKGVFAQAKRLLASAKADASLARMVREWTGTRVVSPADKSPSVFPSFDEEHARSMNESFDRFVVAQVREGGTLSTLLRSADAYVDGTMAAFFGVSSPEIPDGWGKVSLDPKRYSGVMTQPAVMAGLAHADTTSYVRRGKFVLAGLLCQPPAPPPPNAMAKFEQIEKPPNPTGKEIATAVEANPSCGQGNCHTYIDPGGLAFERFDALGHYRTKYPSGKPVDPSGLLPALAGGDVQFADQVEFLAKLADSEVVRACFAKQVFRFAMSRKELEADACAVKALDESMTEAGADLEHLFLAMTVTEAFRYRRDP